MISSRNSIWADIFNQPDMPQRQADGVAAWNPYQKHNLNITVRIHGNILPITSRKDSIKAFKIICR
jgi:hypothetical protein